MNKNISRTIFIILLLGFFAGETVFGGDDFPFVEKHDLNTGSFRGYATLIIEKPTVQSGQSLSVEVRFFNASGGDYFYNPFFDGLIPLPAQLAIYDSNKKYLGDLIEFVAGSRKGIEANDWSFIPSLCYVGTTLNASISLEGLSDARNIPNLASGNYFVQLIFYKSFIASKPNSPNEFYKKFDHLELFRSNLVKIRITK